MSLTCDLRLSRPGGRGIAPPESILLLALCRYHPHSFNRPLCFQVLIKTAAERKQLLQHMLLRPSTQTEELRHESRNRAPVPRDLLA